MSEKRGIFDEKNDAEKPADLDRASTQEPMAARASDYIKTGYLPVVPAADGGVQIAGGEPPDPALMLTENNLVCTEAEGRPECEHFVQFLTEAEGVTKGFGDQLKQIRRYCTKLATATELMEIGEVAVFACSARKPQDLVSIRLIRDFEKRQRDLAAEYAQTEGKTTL